MTPADSIRDVQYTFYAVVIGVMLNYIELFILRPPEPESVWAIQYEMFIAAFGLLWAVHYRATGGLVRWIFSQ